MAYIYSDILPDIFSGIPSGILSGSLSHMLSDIHSGILSGNLSIYVSFFLCLASILMFYLAFRGRVRVQACPAASRARNIEFGSRSRRAQLHPKLSWR